MENLGDAKAVEKKKRFLNVSDFLVTLAIYQS